MLKKALLVTMAMQSIAYADTSYTKYFYGSSKPQRAVRKANYPAQRYSSPRRTPIRPYNRTQGLYIEWYGAGRLSWPFNKIKQPNSSWLKLPFSIPPEKRAGYNKEKRKSFRRLLTPITKSLFTGPIIGWRFHPYAAVEGNGLLLLLPFYNHEHTYYNDKANKQSTARYGFTLGAIPHITAKGIYTFQDIEGYIKVGPAFPIALLYEKGKKTEENGPWTVSCCPQLLISLGGSWKPTREFKLEGSLNLLTTGRPSVDKQTQGERRRSRPANGAAPSPAAPVPLTAAWLQVGASYRLL